MPEAQWDYSLREVERSGRVSEKFRKIRKNSKKFQKIPKNSEKFLKIQGDLGDVKCLEKVYKAFFGDFSCFVYKRLFTLLGHMTNFVYKSHDKNYTR